MSESNFMQTPAAIIDGRDYPCAAGNAIESQDPYTGEVLWATATPSRRTLDLTLESAKQAFPTWAAKPLEDRLEIAVNFTKLVLRDKDRLAQLVAIESGKPLWESKIEVNSLVTKLEASTDAYAKRCADTSRTVKGLLSRTRYRAHGVVVVLGPYNFPLSMANGHTMPALIAGNCVIFKPSELTSLCGIAVASLWREAGLPRGVLNCVAGDASTGRYLTESSYVDGIFFVGSHATGMSILKSNAGNPERIIALEMGGNSPLVIEDFSADKLAAVVSVIIHSAFISGGQRCSAARRLLLNKKCEWILDPLVEAINNLRIGHFQETPEPFCGPMIRPVAVDRALQHLEILKRGSAKCILEPIRTGPYATVLRPGLVNVDSCTDVPDEELFGPILQVETYHTLDEAVTRANRTKFGLAAGIVTQHRSVFDQFAASVKAGIVNWNQQLTGATTFAPFGGAKQSGNYRPAGYLSADYCSYAVASFEVEAEKMVVPDTPGMSA